MAIQVTWGKDNQGEYYGWIWEDNILVAETCRRIKNIHQLMLLAEDELKFYENASETLKNMDEIKLRLDVYKRILNHEPVEFVTND